MKKKTKGKGLIYARYAAPLLSYLILTVYMLIPKIRFSLDGEKRDPISALELLKNSFDNARYYLFSSSTQETAEGILFYKTVFTVIIILSALSLIGFGIYLVTAVVAVLAHSDKKSAAERKKIKDIYTTLIPNRAVLAILGLLPIPLSLLPEITVYLYHKLLLYPVSVKHELFVAPWMVALALYIVSTALIFLAKKSERRSGLDIFSKPKPIVSDSDEAEEEKVRVYHIRSDSESGEEERLKKLFEKDKK